MSLPSLLNAPRTPEQWAEWSFSNAQDHLKIIEAIRAKTGNITAVTLTNGGSGYTSVPNFVLDSNGSGATFNLSISGGIITSLTIDAEGAGYRTSFFEITGGGGTGAAGFITLNPWISLFEYQLDPINSQDPADFIRRHALSHTDMNSALGLQSIDLSELDINDPNKVESWIYSNYQEHNNAHNALQI